MANASHDPSVDSQFDRLRRWAVLDSILEQVDQDVECVGEIESPDQEAVTAGV
jgi:hypothetical protein